LKKKRVLVCPLDWGIGHAGRDVIIIRKLIDTGNDVILGGDGPSLKFLMNEFPELDTVKIPSHRFYYSERSPAWFMILLQVPAFLKGIMAEHRSLKKITRSHNIGFVISDARYGLWNRRIKSAIITHQVRIRMPLVFKPLEFLISFFNRRALEKFSCHWIPDFPDVSNLSGVLSHGISRQSNSQYIGCLSRFIDYTPQYATSGHFEVVILLSGPEPQRTVFEKKVTDQLLNQKRKAVIIGGLIEQDPGKIQDISSSCRRMPFVTGYELYSLLISAKYIICRPGYSTIMDLAAIGKTAFLVPTPGQTEQEYLAFYLGEKGLFRFSSQEDFNLEDAVKKLEESGSPDFSFMRNNLLSPALESFIQGVNCN
jgi:predicted glycosyltransferase